MKKLLLVALIMLMISSFNAPLSVFAQPAGYENITLVVEGRDVTTGATCASAGRAFVTHYSTTEEIQLPYAGHYGQWEIPTWRYYGPNALINQRWKSEVWGVNAYDDWYSQDIEDFDLLDSSLLHEHQLRPLFIID